MALRTLGTNATTSLNAALFSGAGSIGNFDLASFNNQVKNDLINSHPILEPAFMSGQLFIPNRGILQVLPGDFIAVDANGWPLLVSAYSIATGGWTHT